MYIFDICSYKWYVLTKILTIKGRRQEKKVNYKTKDIMYNLVFFVNNFNLMVCSQTQIFCITLLILSNDKLL